MMRKESSVTIYPCLKKKRNNKTHPYQILCSCSNYSSSKTFAPVHTISFVRPDTPDTPGIINFITLIKIPLTICRGSRTPDEKRTNFSRPSIPNLHKLITTRKAEKPTYIEKGTREKQRKKEMFVVMFLQFLCGGVWSFW